MAHVIRIVRWEELSPAQKSDVENLKISDQQIEYAGPIHRAVDACASDLSGDIQGAAIFDGDVIVGFLVLKRRSSSPNGLYRERRSFRRYVSTRATKVWD